MPIARLSLYLSPDVVAWVREVAAAERRTLTAQVEWILRKAMEAEKNDGR